jgi:hypothetical protein
MQYQAAIWKAKDAVQGLRGGSEQRDHNVMDIRTEKAVDLQSKDLVGLSRIAER